MSTMAGSTLAATADELRLPPPFGCGLIACAAGVGCTLFCATCLPSMARARLKPIPTPAAVATTAASTRPAASRCQKDGDGPVAGCGVQYCAAGASLGGGGSRD